MAMTSSTDVVGVIAKTAADAKEVMRVIAGGDNYDSTAQTKIIPDRGVINDFSKIKIGWPVEYFTDGVDLEIKNSLLNLRRLMEGQGAQFIEISLPSTKYGVAVYSVITPAEVSSNLARFDGLRYGYQEAKQGDEAYLVNRGGGFGPEAKRRIMLGTYVLSAGEGHSYYDQAQNVRRWMKADFNQAFEKIDFILTPTVPDTAFNIGEKNSPLSLYLEDSLLTPASLAGLPAVSVPSGLASNGLPIGAQLIGQMGDDFNLLNLASSLKEILNFDQPSFSWE
jgi:aspartyl-tRNA(Asn)/glutamyl-tRNA(Gln) amidotransferase subunit A